MVKPRVSGEFLISFSRLFVCMFSQDILQEVCKVRYRFICRSTVNCRRKFNQFGLEASRVQLLAMEKAREV